MAGCGAQAGHVLRELRAARAALGPHFAENGPHTRFAAFFLNEREFLRRVVRETVDGHHGGHAVFGDVFDVAEQIGQARGQIAFAMVLERAHAGHDHAGVWHEIARRALDIQEFFRAQIRAEACLRHHIIGERKRHFGGDQAVAAVCDVGKGAAVDQRGRAFQGLHQVGLDGVLQQGAQRALRAQIARRDGFLGKIVSHHDARQARLEIGQVQAQAQRGHDFAGHGDVEPVFTRHAVRRAAQAGDDVAQLPVVDIQATPPGDAAGVDAKRVALRDVVVDQRGEQVVGRANGVQIPGEMQVDVLHGNHLRPAAARGAALDAEHRPERRFAQRQANAHA